MTKQRKMKVIPHQLRKVKAFLQREGGFTLVEMLLVLFCITIVLSVTFPIFTARLEHSLYEQAIQKWYLTMYEAQYLAKEQGRRTSITINNENIVTVTMDKVGVISQWALPYDMKVDLNHVNNGIRYTENGNISKVGKIIIETPLWTREYSINFTYGRMRER